MTQPTQVLPYWLSASTTFVTTLGTVFPTTVVVNLPLTYYGPSIPLGTGWVFGGSTSPPPGETLTASGDAASSAATETLSPSPSEFTSGASDTASASISPSVATSSGIPLSGSSGATAASSIPSTFSPESSIAASPSSVTAPITSTPSLSLSSSPLPTSSITSLPSSSSTRTLPLSTFNACITLGSCPSTTGPTTTPTLASANDHNKLSTGAIVAISLVSALAAATLLACCIFLLIRRRRRRSPNRGSPLEGDISALPPALGDEHSSLMAGRRSGGESPELEAGGETVYRDAPRARDEEIASDEEDLSHLPIANKYIAERRMSGSWASRPSSRVAGSLGGGSVGRGNYHAVGDTEAAAEAADVTTVSAPVAAAAGTAAAGAAIAATAASGHQAGEGSGSSASHAHTHSSRGLFHASGSNGDDHHRPGSPTSGGSHENAEVVTAQRATRSPLARLARLSWFARNRNEPGASRAAAGLAMDSDDEGSWVNVRSATQQMGERGGTPLTTPLLSQPPSGGGRIPIITRQAASRSNTALVDTSQQSPPPAAYFNVARSRSTRRQSGQSARSAQSGQTVFFDAEEEPAPPPATARMPPASGSTLTPPVTAGVAQPQRYSIPQSGSESSRGEGPSAADFPVPPPALSPSLSYQWPQFRNSDSQNNDSPSLSATTESPIPPGQPIAGLFTRSLSGVGVIGAPITTSQGDTLEPPVEERRRHVSEPNLREQALAAEGGGHHTRLSTLEESLDDSWRRRAVSPVTASAAAVISGASIYGDERSRRMTLGPTSFVDTPQVVDQSEVASLRGDVHSSYTGNGTQSNRDASYPSRNGQGGTMATHTTFSTGGAQRRLAATPNRPPSLSAIGGRPWSITSDTAAGTASDSGTGTGTGSGTGGSSSQQSPQSVRVSRLTEMGEIRPPQRAAVPPSLAIVGERMRPSIDTPPPPPSAGPHSEGLTPPPPRPWWRPYP